MIKHPHMSHRLLMHTPLAALAFLIASTGAWGEPPPMHDGECTSVS